MGFKRFRHKKCNNLRQNHVFVVVLYFDNSFFIGYIAYSLWVYIVLLKLVHRIVNVCFIDDDAEAPAHVKRLKHLVIRYRVAEFSRSPLN